jgi:transposase InsO family protein
LFGVNRQVYYRRLQTVKRRKSRAVKVIELVESIRIQMPKIGTRKLYFMLEEELKQLQVGRDMLFRILKANHMLIHPRRRYHVTTNSHHRFKKHKNLIENVVPEKPEQIWVSDITYVGNRQNPMYLALVTDAYSKQIMGHDLSNSLDVSGTLRALKMAVKKRRYKNNIITHHSDRGLQYCSNEYQDLLKRSKINCSMTESYDPYANAVAERVNGILKGEFIGYKKQWSLQTMGELVKNSIEIYNEQRPHFSCYYRTPKQMHQQNEVKIKTYKNEYPSKHVFTGI